MFDKGFGKIFGGQRNENRQGEEILTEAIDAIRDDFSDLQISWGDMSAEQIVDACNQLFREISAIDPECAKGQCDNEKLNELWIDIGDWSRQIRIDGRSVSEILIENNNVVSERRLEELYGSGEDETFPSDSSGNGS